MSIAVKNESLRRCESEYKKLSQKLSEIEKSLEKIRKSLDSDVKNEKNIDRDFNKVCEAVDENERSLNNIVKYLSDTAKAYEVAEKNIKNDLNRIGQKKSDSNIDRMLKKIPEQEDEGFSFIDLDRPGRLWDKFLEEPFAIINHPLAADLSMEFFFNDVCGVDIDTYREWRHGILGIAGLLPGPVGPAFDILDIFASIREGQWVDALSSTVFAIPGIGDYAKVIKLSGVQEAFLNLCDATNEVVQDIIDENMDEISGEIDRITDEISEIIVDRINEIPSFVGNPNPIQELIWELINWHPAIPNTPLLVDFWGLNQAAKRFVNIEIKKNVSSVWNELDTPLKN